MSFFLQEEQTRRADKSRQEEQTRRAGMGAGGAKRGGLEPVLCPPKKESDSIHHYPHIIEDGRIVDYHYQFGPVWRDEGERLLFKCSMFSWIQNTFLPVNMHDVKIVTKDHKVSITASWMAQSLNRKDHKVSITASWMAQSLNRKEGELQFVAGGNNAYSCGLGPESQY